MRAIKFRGISTDTKEWQFGSLLWDGERSFIINQQGNNLHHRWEVRPESVGQFSGCFDNTGKEIYEGDIVKGGEVKIMPVVFLQGCWRTTHKGSAYRLFGWKNLEVIGSIHTHPHLIEKEKV